MTRYEHHLHCLGLLAMIYNGKLSDSQRKLAIEQAVESAQSLGLPVSLQRLRNGMPISTEVPKLKLGKKT